jgi:hypothetical protein
MGTLGERAGAEAPAKVGRAEMTKARDREDSGWLGCFTSSLHHLKFPMPFFMMGSAKPHHLKRTGIVIMMSVNTFGTATAFAWLTNQPAAAKRPLDLLMGRSFLGVLFLPLTILCSGPAGVIRATRPLLRRAWADEKLPAAEANLGEANHPGSGSASSPIPSHDAIGSHHSAHGTGC